MSNDAILSLRLRSPTDVRVRDEIANRQRWLRRLQADRELKLVTLRRSDERVILFERRRGELCSIGLTRKITLRRHQGGDEWDPAVDIKFKSNFFFDKPFPFADQ